MYSTPRAWAHKGEHLVLAIEVLASKSEHRSIYFDVHDQALMLAGMSCEVLLKSIIVYCPNLRAVVVTPKKKLDTVGKNQRRVFYSHKLQDLASMAGVQLSDEQKRTAEILSEFISWRGRYVVPSENNIDDLVPVRKPDGLVGMKQNFVTIEDARSIVEHIVGEVSSRLYAD